MKKISMKRPCTIDVSLERTVLAAARSPGNMQRARPPAHMLPMICAGTRKAARAQDSVPARHKPSVTY